MEAFIKGEYVMMMDSLVLSTHREYCRSKTNIDFSDLRDKWINHDEFNKYMTALREKAGEIGPKIIGTKIAGKIDELFKTFSQIPDLATALRATSEAYKMSNTGPDAGEYIIDKVEEGYAKIITNSPLDEGFHVGVGEGIIRFYRKTVYLSQISERRAISGRTVFEYRWR